MSSKFTIISYVVACFEQIILSQIYGSLLSNLLFSCLLQGFKGFKDQPRIQGIHNIHQILFIQGNKKTNEGSTRKHFGSIIREVLQTLFSIVLVLQTLPDSLTVELLRKLRQLKVKILLYSKVHFLLSRAFQFLEDTFRHTGLSYRICQSSLFREGSTSPNSSERNPLMISYWESCRRTMREPCQFNVERLLGEEAVR